MALMEGSLSTSLLVVEPRELALKSTWWRPVLTFLIYVNNPPTHANLSISIGNILKHCPARPVAQFCCRAHCHTSPSASPHPWASCPRSMHFIFLSWISSILSSSSSWLFSISFDKSYLDTSLIYNQQSSPRAMHFTQLFSIFSTSLQVRA